MLFGTRVVFEDVAVTDADQRAGIVTEIEDDVLGRVFVRRLVGDVFNRRMQFKRADVHCLNRRRHPRNQRRAGSPCHADRPVAFRPCS